jgi:hypothetical protein
MESSSSRDAKSVRFGRKRCIRQCNRSVPRHGSLGRTFIEVRGCGSCGFRSCQPSFRRRLACAGRLHALRSLQGSPISRLRQRCSAQVLFVKVRMPEDQQEECTRYNPLRRAPQVCSPGLLDHGIAPTRLCSDIGQDVQHEGSPCRQPLDTALQPRKLLTLDAEPVTLGLSLAIEIHQPVLKPRRLGSISTG